MPNYITDKVFSDDELRNMDIIHNPDVKLFEDQYEDSYTIDNFISEKEKNTSSTKIYEKRSQQPLPGLSIHSHFK